MSFPFFVSAPLFLSTHEWMDLSRAQQRALLFQMTKSFEKPWADQELLLRRFLRPSCRVVLYTCVSGYPVAAAFLWKEPAFLYLDKFFVWAEHRQQRIGTPFFTALLSFIPSSLVWRTDQTLATRFYGKHPLVRTLGSHGDYVYQYSTAQKRRPWEYEDIAPLLRMETAFQPKATAVARPTDAT